MKGGNVKKFIDQTTYEECAIIYKGVKYFFHGIMFDKEKKEYYRKYNYYEITNGSEK